jgi:hypothetical protein
MDETQLNIIMGVVKEPTKLDRTQLQEIIDALRSEKPTRGIPVNKR